MSSRLEDWHPANVATPASTNARHLTLVLI
jgi:hypothetical protein